MYKDNIQLRIEDFVFLYGRLDRENDWVKQAALVPWDAAEERYSARFVNNSHPAHPPQMALGVLLIQRWHCITEITLVIGHLGKQINDFFGDGSGFGVHINYVWKDEPLGTAGALFYLRDQVTDDFLLLNGDLIFDVDIRRLMDFHKSRNAAATLLAHPNDHPYDSGIILAGNDGKVNGWLTKEDKREWYRNCVNAGIHNGSSQENRFGS